MSDDEIIDGARHVLAFILAFVLVALGIAWAVQGNEFFLAKMFAPRTEQIRHNTFKQSQAYTDGIAQELRRMQSEYLRAKPEQKDALASIIRHQFADVDEGRLPADLRDFLRDIRQNQGSTQ